MANAFVQWNVSSLSDGVSSGTVTNASHANVAGNFLVAIVDASNSQTVVSVVDSANGTYTFLMSIPYSGGGSDVIGHIFYRQNCAAASIGTNTVTVTFTAAAGFPEIRFMEFSGILTSGNPVHLSSTGSANGGTTQATGNITTTVTGCLLLAGNVCGNTSTGPGTNFAWVQAGITPGTNIDEYILNVGTGTYQAQFAGATPGDWVSWIVAFLPSGGGGTQNATGSIGSAGSLTPTSRALRGANEPLASRSTITPTAKALHSASVVI